MMLTISSIVRNYGWWMLDCSYFDSCQRSLGADSGVFSPKV